MTVQFALCRICSETEIVGLSCALNMSEAQQAFLTEDSMYNARKTWTFSAAKAHMYDILRKQFHTQLIIIIIIHYMHNLYFNYFCLMKLIV